MVGEDNMRHSHATHDLYNAIDQGNFPVWNFAVQVRGLAQSRTQAWGVCAVAALCADLCEMVHCVAFLLL